MAMTNPYSFLPWLVGGVMKLEEVENSKQNVAYQSLTAAALYGLCLSGCPNPAFYGFFVLLFLLAAWVADEPKRLARMWRKLVTPIACFAVVIVPLWVMALQVYEFYGRPGIEGDWVACSVPFRAYIGLLLPNTDSLWTLFWGRRWLLTNNVLFVGIVPVWYVALSFVRHPSFLLRPVIFIHLTGTLLFIILMSPGTFGLTTFFSQMPVLNSFRFPMRALPAFQLVLVCLFMTTVRLTPTGGRRLFLALLPVVVIGASLQMLGEEARRNISLDSEGSWYKVAPDFRDKESWKESTMDQLRKSGFVAIFCRQEPSYLDELYSRKPGIFFHGNLGAQYAVRTVGSYMMGHTCNAYRQAGMDYRGRFIDWPPAKNIILVSPRRSLDGEIRWDSGIGPWSAAELAEKTYIGGIIVEASWQEPMSFFRQSREWRLLDENQWAAVFTRANR